MGQARIGAIGQAECWTWIDDGAGCGADSRSVVGEIGSTMVRLSVVAVFWEQLGESVVRRRRYEGQWGDGGIARWVCDDEG